MDTTVAPVDRRPGRRRLAAAGGVAGPVAFAAAWSLLGPRLPGYSPVDDPISRLAAAGARDAAVMTGGLVAFGVGLPLYGAALRDALPGPAWATATATGLAALGVAAFPLASSRDALHGAMAGVAYATLAATPLLAAAPLARAGRRRWAGASVAAGTVSALALSATAAGPATGLFQRVGLTVAHAWVVASAVGILAGRWPAPRPRAAPAPARP